MIASDRRLIEDYLPVDWLSAEASGEPRTKGHISTLHLWRARRALVACRAGGSRPLLSPGDVPIQDSDVRLALFKEVGQREDFQACLEHDFVGANTRTRRTDDRRARAVSSEAGKRPASRLATAMLMYSFGGLSRLDVVGMGGRPLQTTLDEKKRARIHQRLLELLTTVHRKVFDTVASGKIVDLFKLGVPESGSPDIQTDRVVAGFFSFRGFPRLHSENVVRKAIARGVETGRFGYATGRPALDDTGRYQIDRSRVAFERSIADDEIDLDCGNSDYSMTSNRDVSSSSSNIHALPPGGC